MYSNSKLVTFLFCLLTLTTSVAASADREDAIRLYVWNLQPDQSEASKLIAESLTSTLEEQLLESRCVPLVQRRALSSLLRHRDQESMIRRIDQIPQETKSTLATLSATGVILGTVVDDFESGEIKVSVRVDLFDGLLMTVESVRFSRGKRLDGQSRENAMRSLARDLCSTFVGFGDPLAEIIEDPQANALGAQGSLVALMPLKIRDQPDYRGRVLEELPAGARIPIVGQTNDLEDGYLKVTTRGGVDAFAHESRLGSLGKISTAGSAPISLPLEKLLGVWVQVDPDDEFAIVRTFSFLDRFLDPDRTYNGQSDMFRRVGGRHRNVGATPTTWDLSVEGDRIDIELWTDFTEKGHRMKWDVSWNLRAWEPAQGKLTFVQEFIGLDGVSTYHAYKCGYPGADSYRLFCAVESQRFRTTNHEPQPTP